MSGNRKFAKTWGNQTDIGRHFNMSAIALGKFLTAQGLRDPSTKLATDRAIAEGYAMATPLRDGTPFFMWNRSRIGDLLRKSGIEKADPTDYHTNCIFAEMKQLLTPTDDDKMDRIVGSMWEDLFNEMLTKLPKAIRPDVRSAVIRRLIEKDLLDPDYS